MKKQIAIIGCSAGLLIGGANAAEAHPRQRKPVSGNVWERLAQCESGGNWHQRGRKYSGGVQFADATWRSVGGVGRAADASKSEQIGRAIVLQRKHGWGQWPACSRKLGLR